MRVNPDFYQAELGYWVGVPHWNQGYCTEAARAVINYAFAARKLHKICAHHLTRNPASGRVLRKLGLTQEGSFKEHVYRWGRFEDIDLYGALARDWRGLPDESTST